MKIPLSVHCVECTKENTVQIDLHDASADFACQSCGARNFGPFALSFSIGERLIRRAMHELNTNNDPSMAIVLAAMSFECELSTFHHNWEHIRGLLQTTPEMISDAELDEKLRRYRNIADKVDGVAKLMHGPGIEDFVNGNPGLQDLLAKNVTAGIRLGTIAADVQQHLFWPRNRVLHLGDSSYGIADARRCIAVALIGLRIFRQLHLAARDKL